MFVEFNENLLKQQKEYNRYLNAKWYSIFQESETLEEKGAERPEILVFVEY